MAMFVHIAPEPMLKRILKNGIAPTVWSPDPERHPQHDRVVWSFPVLESATLTLSWARELKRGGHTTQAAITFRLRDDEPVYVRHYRDRPQAVSAAASVALVRAAADPRGFEVLVPRRVRPDEIVRARIVRRAFGWRYAPHLKGLPPAACDCPMCLPRDEVKAARQRERIWARMEAAGLEPDSRLAQRPRRFNVRRVPRSDATK